jgi:hypothetical protein
LEPRDGSVSRAVSVGSQASEPAAGQDRPCPPQGLCPQGLGFISGILGLRVQTKVQSRLIPGESLINSAPICVVLSPSQVTASVVAGRFQHVWVSYFSYKPGHLVSVARELLGVRGATPEVQKPEARRAICLNQSPWLRRGRLSPVGSAAQWV